jgi:hypothetical protein
MLESQIFSHARAMPKAVELFFVSTGLVFLIAGTVRSLAVRQRWKTHSSVRDKRFKMSKQERLEYGLFTLGWTISWALGPWDWWMRAAFGVLGLVSVIRLLYQLDFRAEDAPTYDQASTLHLES